MEYATDFEVRIDSNVVDSVMMWYQLSALDSQSRVPGSQSRSVHLLYSFAWVFDKWMECLCHSNVAFTFHTHQARFTQPKLVLYEG